MKLQQIQTGPRESADNMPMKTFEWQFRLNSSQRYRAGGSSPEVECNDGAKDDAPVPNANATKCKLTKMLSLPRLNSDLIVVHPVNVECPSVDGVPNVARGYFVEK